MSDDLRLTFEKLARPGTFGLTRSRRGTYKNPALQRDWKWFQLGAALIIEIQGRKDAAHPAVHGRKLGMTAELKCLRCGRDGHLAEDCKLPVLPDDWVLAVHDTTDHIAHANKMVSAGCGECSKQQSDGWALYCVGCIEKMVELGAFERQERHALQTDGKHPAPCARFCEANAFEISLRQRDRRIAELGAQAQALRLDKERTGRNRDMWRGQCDRQAEDLRALRRDADLLRVEVAGQESAIGHLSRLVDAERGDATRYRWLRTRDLDAIAAGGVFAGKTPENVVLNEDDLDQAIDAAIAATSGVAT